MIVTTTAIAAFEIIYLNSVGSLLPSAKGNQYILTMQCDLAKFITVTAIKNKSSETLSSSLPTSVVDTNLT